MPPRAACSPRSGQSSSATSQATGQAIARTLNTTQFDPLGLSSCLELPAQPKAELSCHAGVKLPRQFAVEVAAGPGCFAQPKPYEQVMPTSAWRRLLFDQRVKKGVRRRKFRPAIKLASREV